ncbi:MAG: SDR family NAD(P)-dependent oxidoreductase [Victivallales bacterium]|nr:SDR family NAD(P)-dependent oxidoreductase [Victivallales bacterium]
MQQKLETIAALSRFYGNNSLYVFLGGGNTSVKSEKELYIKPSGKALATIHPQDFLRIDRATLRNVFKYALPQKPSDEMPETQRRSIENAREAIAGTLLQASVHPSTPGRPSVETPVHEVFDWTYVVHLHPAYINGMTCAKQGKEACAKLFPDALWLDYCDPGITLALTVKAALDEYKAAKGAQPHVFFLENHGVFVGADTGEEIEAIYAEIIEKLSTCYKEAGVLSEEVELPQIAEEELLELAPKLRTLLAADEKSRAVVAAIGVGKAFAGPLTPDHIVYAKSFAYAGEATAEGFAAFKTEKGYLPKVVEVSGKGVFAVGDTLKSANAAATALKNALLVEKLSTAFGGPKYLSTKSYGFIENWEVESYRSKVSLAGAQGRLNNRICVVTGGAQGFGLGIAEYLAANGGILVIADMNLAGAQAAADGLNAKYGQDRAFAVEVNIADEASVAAMMTAITRKCGGIDLFVANAGVAKAGSVMEMEKKTWDFVTNINYTGYFLCCKYASRVMAKQIVDGKGLWSDIVQVNSKSGLEGSDKNGAYAGSKFGTIGLTQSFAKELVAHNIKVNSVCPGNYLDGPLWSDPVKGLFVQYLNAGKVPGATCVEDVRRFYMNKVPMRRGCLPPDVAKAIIYCVEQEYETGQAIPVTGGQVMLN